MEGRAGGQHGWVVGEEMGAGGCHLPDGTGVARGWHTGGTRGLHLHLGGEMGSGVTSLVAQGWPWR